jgi:hypothetical protein
MRIARRRRGRVPIDVPHLRGDDIDTQRKRRLFVRADQARRRRTAEKEARLSELRSKGFSNLKALKRALRNLAQNSPEREGLKNLYQRYRGWKKK